MNAWLSSFSSVELLKFWFLACPQRFNFYLFAENLNFHGWHPEEESICTHMPKMQFLLAWRRFKIGWFKFWLSFAYRCTIINYLKCSLGYIWLNWWLNYPAFKTPWAKKVEWSFESSTIQVFYEHFIITDGLVAATLVRASRVWLMVMDLNLYHSKCFHKCNLSLHNHLIQSFEKHSISHFSCNDWQNNHEIRKEKPQVRCSKLHPWWSQNWEHNWSLDSRWYEGQNQPLKPP
jgi:hypothetical protein